MSWFERFTRDAPAIVAEHGLTFMVWHRDFICVGGFFLDHEPIPRPANRNIIGLVSR